MLSPYRVLDLSDERGLFCSRILAELGADVIHVEPPTGSPARHTGPHAGSAPDPERSLTWWAMAKGTRSAALDLEDAADRQRFFDLVRSADILIESADPGTWEERGLGYADLAVINPRLVWVSITAFGSTGPKAGYAATDLTVQASSGAMAITGEPDRAPLRAATVPAWTHAAADAAGGALIALREARHSGRGQRVEVSAQRSTNLTAQFTLPAAHLGHVPITRAGGFNIYGVDVPFIWPAADGYVSLTLALDPVNKPFLDRLLAFMVEEGHATPGVTDRDWVGQVRLVRNGEATNEAFVQLREAVAEFLVGRTKADLFAAALDRKLLLVPVSTFDDLYESPQLAHRQFWRTEVLPDGSTARLPGHLTRSTRPSSSTRRTPAPTVGQHTRAILAELEGSQANDPVPTGALDQALSGVKVLDMMWVMAGPASTGVLAQYGATVVRVENEARLDTARLLAPWYGGKVGKETSFAFGSINANKLSITIDPNSPEGRETILELVQWADIVTESFSPRAMAKWGLDYASLKKVKPDLIMLSSCLMGQDGPHAYIAGYGTMGSAAAGLVQPTGWPDRGPNGPYGAYTDYCAPRISLAAMLAALDHRDRTGEGQYLDQSQIESTVNYIAPALLDHQINDTAWDRVANADPDMFPHDAFRSAGDDDWVAIACRHDGDWAALCALLAAEGLTQPHWSALDVDQRRAMADQINDAITQWTAGRTADNAEIELQRVGVPSHAVVHTGMPLDAQLEHLGHLVDVTHPSRGPAPIERTRIDLSRTPPQPSHVPKLGQHTEDVLRDILGYDEARIAALRQVGALGSARPT